MPKQIKLSTILNKKQIQQNEKRKSKKTKGERVKGRVKSKKQRQQNKRICCGFIFCEFCVSADLDIE